MSTRRNPCRWMPRLGGLAVALLCFSTSPAASAKRDPSGHKPPNSRASLVRELERVTEGLVFASESDYPLSVVYWRQPVGTLTAGRIATLIRRPEPDTVEEVTFDDFFRVATTPQSWHTGQEQAIVRRYQALVRALKASLRDIHVFRFGQSTIHAYVVGVTANGDWAGLSTVQIET